MSEPLLSVEGLTLDFATARGWLRALDDVAIQVAKGEVLGLVGESGSGKSTIGLAILGLLGQEASIRGGRILLHDQDLVALSEERRRRLRGEKISIVFQDPFTSLNPALQIGLQVAEPLMIHRGMDREQAWSEAVQILGEVGLPDPQAVAAAYPHQLSGGMRQRALIATAIVCDPDLLILDEPTTALDVTIEAQILDLLDRIRQERRVGILFITHNIGIVNRFADRVCVLYAGRVVETGPKRDVLSTPSHPYSKGLLASIPRLAANADDVRLAPIPGRLPDMTDPPRGCVFEPRCPFSEAKCLEPQGLLPIGAAQMARCWKADTLLRSPWPLADTPVERERRRVEGGGQPLLEAIDLQKAFHAGGGLPRIEWRREGRWLPSFRTRRRAVRALDGVSLEIGRGEVLGLVGESGSGKSTLARTVLRLIDPDAGRVYFGGEEIASLPQRRLRDFRAKAQIVFQNPDSSLNPRRSVGEVIRRAASLYSDEKGEALRRRVETLLGRVGLAPTYYDRYPHQLSGGEKQRVGIARALATRPEFVVCDEPVSALDVSVQATVLNLLADLRADYRLAYLFISHDLAVVAHIADRIAVMYAGRIVESGRSREVLGGPSHPYTEALLSAVSAADPAVEQPQRILLRSDGPPSSRGCPFHPRCPRKIGRICEEDEPPAYQPIPGHRIACHLGAAEFEDWEGRTDRSRRPAMS